MLSVKVAVSDGGVVLLLSKHADWVRLTPEQARELASDLVRKSEVAEKGEKSGQAD